MWWVPKGTFRSEIFGQVVIGWIGWHGHIARMQVSGGRGPPIFLIQRLQRMGFFFFFFFLI